MTWQIQRKPYYVQTGSARDNPHGVPPAEIDRMEADLPAEVVAQTIYGMFVEMSGVVFSAEIAAEMFMTDMPKVMGDYYLDKDAAVQCQIDRKHDTFNFYRYAHGIDLARRKDYTVISVLDCQYEPAKLVYWRRINRVPWPRIYAEIGRALWLFPGEQLQDATGAGDTITEELQNRLYCPKHHITFEADQTCPRFANGEPCFHEPGWVRLNPIPFVFTQATKVMLINHLQQCMGHGYDPTDLSKRFGAIRVPPIDRIMEEIQEYQWMDKKIMTDCVFSLALAAMQGIHLQVGDAAFGSVFGT